MEIIEKQIEKVKEVPCGYWDNHNNYSPCNRYASNGKGNAALTLGII